MEASPMRISHRRRDVSEHIVQLQKVPDGLAPNLQTSRRIFESRKSKTDTFGQTTFQLNSSLLGHYVCRNSRSQVRLRSPLVHPL
jgi:hypothetical protein